MFPILLHKIRIVAKIITMACYIISRGWPQRQGESMLQQRADIFYCSYGICGGNVARELGHIDWTIIFVVVDVVVVDHHAPPWTSWNIQGVTHIHIFIRLVFTNSDPFVTTKYMYTYTIYILYIQQGSQNLITTQWTFFFLVFIVWIIFYSIVSCDEKNSIEREYFKLTLQSIFFFLRCHYHILQSHQQHHKLFRQRIIYIIKKNYKLLTFDMKTLFSLQLDRNLLLFFIGYASHIPIYTCIYIWIKLFIHKCSIYISWRLNFL